MIMPKSDEEPRLPFETKKMRVNGGVIEEYIIPEEQKADVLDQLYPFEPVPALDEERYDLHEGKKFLIKDFRVTRENGMNYLVSPYYANSGGSVIDWMPADWEE
jgi:hypothetical protein